MKNFLAEKLNIFINVYLDNIFVYIYKKSQVKSVW